VDLVLLWTFTQANKAHVSYLFRRTASSSQEPLARSQGLRSCSRCCTSRIARASRLAARLATKWRQLPRCGDFWIAFRWFASFRLRARDSMAWRSASCC